MRAFFILSQMAKGLRSNKAMALSVILVTFVSLLFVGASSLLQKQISNLKDDWYDKVEVSAFMCAPISQEEQCAGGEATEEQIAAVEEFLASDDMAPYVDEVFFETKKQALENYRKQMKGTDWENWLTEEQMQVSFRIKLVNPQRDYQTVADALSGRSGVEQVSNMREKLERIFDILNKFTVIAAVVAVTMIITALMLIWTTIRLSAMSRKNETEIMRYVGASNLFIELPFILEGVVSALIGAILAVIGLWAVIHFFIHPWFSSPLLGNKIIGAHDVQMLAPMLTGGAIVIAVLASWLALRKYARV